MRIFLAIWLFVFSSSSLGEPLTFVAKKGLTELMIFGSIHAGRQDMYPLPNQVIEYLDSSDGLILEADIWNEHLLKIPSDQPSTKSVLAPNQYKQLIQKSSEVGIQFEQFSNLPPWQAAIALQSVQLIQAGFDFEAGIDLAMLDKAEILNKPVLHLEQLQFQLDLISTLGSDGNDLLLSTVDELKHGRENIECMVESWNAGDIENWEAALMGSTMPTESEDKLLYNRNKDWADTLVDNNFYPKQGKYLVVVGGLHLIGKRSLIDYLEQNGFVVTQVSKSIKADCNFLLPSDNH